jgi:phosphate starvation-inducible PhoH-like protein
MLSPKTLNQMIYVKKLLNLKKPIVVAAGPAGCGKTLLACQVAAQKILSNQYDRIIVTRPTVSVDEDLGFLPGKLEKKMEPWVKPMFEIFEKERIQKSVEIVPLAYMRGRTFKNSFIIADEMQNSTPNQMKMVMTRIGDESKMVITGDFTQSDLHFKTNGLEDLFFRISEKDLEYIDHIIFANEDIQRHPAVTEVLSIY